MDLDVIATTLGVIGLAILASALGYRFSFILPPKFRVLLFAIAMLVASLYAAVFVGRLEAAPFFPSGLAIFASNITPILIAFAAGLGWTLPSITRRQRQARFVGITLLSFVFYLAPVLRPVIRPVVSDEKSLFVQNICLQSHPATCGAAAAATLLNLHGISVSEYDMIRACLTSQDGTEPLGLYRGLVAHTKARRVTPRLAAKDSARWTALQQYPLVALVTFRKDNDLLAGDTNLRRMFGRDAEGHAIVVLGQSTDGQYIIGDPAVGRTLWDQKTFARRFTGQAIFLSGH